MKCPRCGQEILIKKNLLYNCQCGARLLAILIKGKLEIFDLKKEDN